ncbi:CRISPR-associated helicase Cas3' [Metasolibacillus sp. FSL H7-0170]|uniref:CRISPR-associated helicase Cas3' n=1 Tax=Metasolibacillus sp. FSL H7-0170 TaxID=2921431 RepID=UPI003158CDB2
MYIAHVRKSDGVEQLLKDHLCEVQQICEAIGEKFQMPKVFGLAGLLHDAGKYSDDFQIYLRDAIANPEEPPRRGSVNHSTAGGRLLMEKFHKGPRFMPVMIEMVANAIYSHHGQLHDFIDSEGNSSPFLNRADNEKIPMSQIRERFFNEVMSEEQFDQYVMQAASEFQSFLQKHFQKDELQQILYKFSPLLTMTIYSSLIDADRTNSREFDENSQIASQQPIQEKFKQYLIELESSFKKMQEEAIPNEITKLRQEMSENCANKADLPTGIYSLSIPTGGGKTLASLRFALEHAIKHGKERIIYIIPFTTIIEQNAQAVRELLKTDEVLEHHSNVVDDVGLAKTYEEMLLQRKLNQAKDNWDSPIVFTTMVQYLNSFYSGKSRNLRRMHNLANAVLIFDEVQSVPVKCVSLFNETINFLSKYAKSTVLLCTATQPALQYVEQRIEVNEEIIDNLPRIEKAFKRTNIVRMDEHLEWNTEQLADFIEKKLEDVKSILIISNNKKTTKNLYEKFKDLPYVYHLSTGMCPAHRKEKLKQMTKNLKAGKQVLCMSTQLIEAGVDVSFECVMRSLAGVDSIAQAAGRCNRNGEVQQRDVYVFKHAEEVLSKLPTIEKGQRCASHLLRDIEERNLFEGELLSSPAIEFYFKQYYENLALELDFPVRNLDKTLHQLLFTNDVKRLRKLDVVLSQSFDTAAKHFEVIEANTEAIVVPYGEGAELIAQLASHEPVDYKVFLKKAQQFSVNVFPHEFRALQQEQLIRPVDFGTFKIWLAMENAYDEEYGLSVSGEAGLNILTL